MVTGGAKLREAAAACAVLLALLQSAGCLSQASDPEAQGHGVCDPESRAATRCEDGVQLWVDGCGEVEGVKEVCECGCADHTSCVERCGVEPQCDDAGVCADACQPSICAQAGLDCGDHTGADGCGGDLSCDDCPAGQRCGPDGRCSVAGCTDGLQRCGDSCVDPLTDARHCGGCEIPCDPGEVCEGGRCRAADDCREQPCTGFTYCDLATGQCLPGCLTDEQCPSNEACDIASHACECIDEHHRCSGVCVDSRRPAHCGARCGPCPTDPHGTATCESGVCGIRCHHDYHMCDVCVSDDDVRHCGTSCAPCVTEGPNQVVACVELGDGVDVCESACAPGFHDCDASSWELDCRADDDINACGESCVVCEPAENSTGMRCSDGDCVADCDEGLFSCHGGCVLPTDNAACGVDCQPCVSDDSETFAYCEDGTCGVHCRPPYADCGGTCTRVDNDARHCGDCDHPCASDEVCTAGECVRGCTSYSFDTAFAQFLQPWDSDESYNTTPIHAVTEDFDNDGFKDLAIVWEVSGPLERLMVYATTESGLESRYVHEAASLKGLQVIDFDADGFLDLVSLVDTGEEQHLTIFLNDLSLGGDLDDAFTPLPYVDIGSPMNFALSDFNRDGHQDIYAHYTDKLVVWNFDATQSAFVAEVLREEMDQRPHETLVADLDGNGFDDIVFGGWFYWFNLGRPGGFDNFQDSIYRPGALVSSLALIAGDFNGDSHLDFVGKQSTHPWYARLAVNNGAGDFAFRDIPGGTWEEVSVVEDFDGDGDLDVAGMATDSMQQFYILFSDGQNPDFERHTYYTYSGASEKLVALDYDHDGVTDLVTITRNVGYPFEIYPATCD